LRVGRPGKWWMFALYVVIGPQENVCSCVFCLSCVSVMDVSAVFAPSLYLAQGLG